MSLLTCEHCGEIFSEERIDTHLAIHHPKWAVALEEKIGYANQYLARIADVLETLERRDEQRRG